jgi:hypothetical protein
MGWSLEDIFGGAVAGGSVSGWNPYVMAGGALIGALSGGGSKGGSKTETTEVKRVSTPVTWITKSGKRITLYDHGPGSSTTTTNVSANNGGPLSAASDAMQGISLWKKYGMTGTPAAAGTGGGVAEQTQVPESGVLAAGSPADQLLLGGPSPAPSYFAIPDFMRRR